MRPRQVRNLNVMRRYIAGGVEAGCVRESLNAGVFQEETCVDIQGAVWFELKTSTLELEIS